MDCAAYREAYPITAAQRLALLMITDHIDAHGYPPTLRELIRALGFGRQSVNAVSDVLRALERKGYIRVTPGKARAIRVLDRCGLGT